MRSRGRMLELISHQDGPTVTWALTHALIGGVQPKHGWWAPVAQCHIRRGWEPLARGARFTVTITLALIRSRGRHCQRREAPRHCFLSSPPIAALAQIFTDEPVINADYSRWYVPSPNSPSSLSPTSDLSVGDIFMCLSQIEKNIPT
jgi:hypothetical protein